jgi:hypothetical protein
LEKQVNVYDEAELYPPGAMCPVDATFDVDISPLGECKCHYCGTEWLIPVSRQQIEDYLRPFYLSDEVIAQEAYAIWEQEGRPDGESKWERFDMKIKDYHWWMATMKLETVMEFDVGTYKILLDHKRTNPDFKNVQL